MIRPPSSQRAWDCFATCDPAIIRPPTPPEGDLTEEQRKAYKDEVEAYVTKIRVARETGDWTAVLVDGAATPPTKFVLGQVDRNIWREVMDRAILPGDSHRHIGPSVANALMFRLALRSVVGFDKFERVPDPKWENWTMAPASLVTMFDEIDASIVGEIGAEVFRRLQGIRPL